MTDMDSIGSAIACAELYGGVAARGSEINSETRWALEGMVPRAVNSYLRRYALYDECSEADIGIPAMTRATSHSMML